MHLLGDDAFHGLADVLVLDVEVILTQGLLDDADRLLVVMVVMLMTAFAMIVMFCHNAVVFLCFKFRVCDVSQ